MTEKQQFVKLVNRYINQKSKGALRSTSEEDMRGWIDNLLEVFGWDTKDTLQVSKEKKLSAAERAKLKAIGSTHNKPDYTLKNNETRICFVDAKNITDDIFTNQSFAFQIRSYGYSINAQISILTNFEQIAVYDCSIKPSASDNARICRIASFRIENYIADYESISNYLNRTKLITATKINQASNAEPIDEAFAKELKTIRLKIGEEIANASTPKLCSQDLNYLTQTIINRILFIRVCEAHGLEKDGLLQDFAAKDFWNEFSRSSYGVFYDKYDGPLFKKDDELRHCRINNSAFIDYLAILYYPSPYCFDVISLNSISDIYDLFLGFQLDYDSAGNVIDKQKIDVPKTGSVTTPKEVVDAVIKSTIGTDIKKSLSSRDILSNRILDPACGSGSFLISAFNLIEKEVIARNKRIFSKKSPGYCKSHGKKLIDINGRKDIISRCLFGVDISREAVEVAKLSLSLRILDGYDEEDYSNVGLTGSQILNGIGANIKCGNTLVSDDILESYPALTSKPDELVETNIFDWNKAFPSVFENGGGFNYIIGNPPYVEVVNYNKRLPTMAQYIKTKYTTCSSGKIDLSIPFIDRAISLLSPQNGKLGFITQKRFFVADYGDKIRQKLISDKLVKAIFDYDNQEVFKGLNTYVCILICSLNTKNKCIQYSNLLTGKNRSIPLDGLNDCIWCLNEYPTFKISESLRKKLGSFIDVCEISDGIQVLWKGAYQIAPTDISGGMIHGSSKIDQDVKIEASACRPLVRNDAFYPFAKPKYGMYAIFPYEIVSGDAQPIQFTDFCTRFPEAGKYLIKHKAVIESKVETVPVRTPSKSKTEDWHLYTRCSHLADNGPKICIPVVSLEPQAGIISDSDVYLDNANIYFLKEPTDDLDKMYAIAAIVNSTPFSSFAKCYAQPQSGGYWKFNKQALQEIPFPVDALRSKDQRIMQLVQLGKRLEELQARKKTMGTLSERIQPAIDSCWKKVDEICDILFGLSEKDRVVVYENKRRDRYEREY